MTDTVEEYEHASTKILPDELTYGFVADRVLLAIGDTKGDPDRNPDGLAAVGTVTLRPLKESHYTKNDPATVVQKPIVCTIYHGDDPTDDDFDPKRAGLLVDPAGHIGNVSLVCGRYEAIYRLERGTPPKRVEFTVLPEHTNANPLWLPGEAEIVEAPFERFIVNERVQTETFDARDAAKQYRDAAKTERQAAQTARTGAETAETKAGTHATASAASASTAADILAANQALEFSVDMSVGERIFVGETMIYGDTGRINYGRNLIGEVANRTPFTSRFQRVGNTVIWFFYGNLIVEGTQTIEGFFPDGFKPSYTHTVRGNAATGTMLYDFRLIANSGNLQLKIPGERGLQEMFIYYETNDAWPTDIPSD